MGDIFRAPRISPLGLTQLLEQFLVVRQQARLLLMLVALSILALEEIVEIVVARHVREKSTMRDVVNGGGDRP